MQGSFSDESLVKYQEMQKYLFDPSIDYMEVDSYDFTRCLRPNGTAYGTRGACLPPNRVAPQQDVSMMNQKDFIAGGGTTAMGRDKASSTDIVNRGRAARAKAFAAGGGTTALGKASREEIERSGAKARQEALEAGGGKKSGKSIEETIAQGKENRRNAFIAGGGNAAVKSGKSVAEVIREGAASMRAAYEAGGGERKYDITPPGFGRAQVLAQGKENLRRTFEAGGGEEARARGLSVKEIMEKGKKALAEARIAGGGEAASGTAREIAARGSKALREATIAGGGDARRGREIMQDPMSFTSRSTFESGGGQAALARIVKDMERRKGRKLNEEEARDARARVAGAGVDYLNKYFKDGGGVKALASGKTVDEIIDEGERISKRNKQRVEEEAARTARNRLERGSQLT